MKRALQKWSIFPISILFFYSCNIKAPLDDVLPEGNIQVAENLTLSEKNDTFLIRNYFPQIETIDSITSKTIEAKPIDKKIGQFVVNSKSGKDAIHEIHVWKQGKKSSLIAIQRMPRSLNSQNIELTIKSFLNNVIFVTSNDHPTKVVVVWQNTILPDLFVTNDNKGISIFIPKEAKAIHHSSLRVFVQNKKKSTGILSINLTNGEPVFHNKTLNN